MKTQKHTVVLPQELKTRLEAREYLKQLEQVGEKDTFVFDFAEVQFVGRSFADEFYNLFFKQKDKRIKSVNQSEEIQIIFRTVEATQHKEKKSEPETVVNEFNTIDDVSAFMSTL